MQASSRLCAKAGSEYVAAIVSFAAENAGVDVNAPERIPVPIAESHPPNPMHAAHTRPPVIMIIAPKRI